MKPISNWESIQDNDYKQLLPGGYVVGILDIENDESKEYLKITYDIAEGNFRGYHTERFKNFNYSLPTFYRSYKESALSMFKGFITSIEKSNKGYAWNWDESTLKNKKFGIILQEEDYVPSMGKYAGEVRTRLIVGKVVDIDTIHSGDYTIPNKKVAQSVKDLQSNQSVDLSKVNTFSITDDDMPF